MIGFVLGDQSSAANENLEVVDVWICWWPGVYLSEYILKGSSRILYFMASY